MTNTPEYRAYNTRITIDVLFSSYDTDEAIVEFAKNLGQSALEGVRCDHPGYDAHASVSLSELQPKKEIEVDLEE